MSHWTKVNMAIPKILKRAGAWSLLAASIAPLSAVPVAYAQEVVTTPPELRDFRLDAPPPAPATESQKPAPLPEPQQDAPDLQRPSTPQSTTSSPAVKATAPAPTAQPPERDVQAPRSAEPPQEIVQPPSVTPPPDSAASAAPAAAQQQNDAGQNPLSGEISPTYIAAGAALMLAMVFAAWLSWRRRQRATSVPGLQRYRRTLPTRPVAVLPPQSPTPRPLPPAMPLLTRRNVTMNFVPTHAVVSFSSLTIEGHLQISNTDTGAADHLVLHTILISASHDQKQAIDSFFADPGQFAPVVPIAAIGPGEHISAPLKLAAALTAMHTFSLQDKTLLAPIIVARLARLSHDGTTQEWARLVCMIGREASPPQTRMGPLRLDQGPRKFDRLGQRALVA